MTDTETKKHPRRRRGRRGRRKKAELAPVSTSMTATDKVASLRKRLQAIKGTKPT